MSTKNAQLASLTQLTILHLAPSSFFSLTTNAIFTSILYHQLVIKEDGIGKMIFIEVRKTIIYFL